MLKRPEGSCCEVVLMQPQGHQKITSAAMRENGISHVVRSAVLPNNA